jgi:AcrR family transcriptional regulator
MQCMTKDGGPPSRNAAKGRAPAERRAATAAAEAGSASRRPAEKATVTKTAAKTGTAGKAAATTGTARKTASKTGAAKKAAATSGTGKKATVKARTVKAGTGTKATVKAGTVKAGTAKGARRTGRPVAADSVATRRAIVDAATMAFGSHGYEGTSIQIIAEQAGLTAATLYHYFPGKAAIFQTVGDEVTREFRRRTDAAIEGVDSARMSVAAVLRALGDWVIEQPEIASFIATYAAEVARNREVRRLSPTERWTEPMRYYSEFARRGLDRGEIAADLEPDEFAGLVQGLIYGMSALVTVGRAFGPPDRLVDAFVRTIEGTVFIDP